MPATARGDSDCHPLPCARGVMARPTFAHRPGPCWQLLAPPWAPCPCLWPTALHLGMLQLGARQLGPEEGLPPLARHLVRLLQGHWRVCGIVPT